MKTKGKYVGVPHTLSAFDDNLKAATRDNERRDIDECLERSFPIEIRFFDEK